MTIRVMFAIGSMGGGGSERQIWYLLRGLDRSRFTPLLYLVTRSGELLPHVPEDVPIAAFWDRHPSPRIYWPGRIHRMIAADLAEQLRREKIDLVYDRTYHMTLVTAAAVRRSPAARISTIVTAPAHDLTHPRARFLRLKRYLLRRAYQTADCTIAVSEALRQNAAEYYNLPAEQIVTIPNPIDITYVDRMTRLDPPTWDNSQFHIVAAGRLHQQKGYLDLFRAVAEVVHRRGLTRLRLHILGEGPQEAELRREITSLDLGQHVTLEGLQENPFSWFDQANLYCLTSKYEGSPNALAEAMACRVPVLATDCPCGPAELLDGGRFGRLIPVGDVAAMADSLEDAMTNPAKWRELVEPARQRIERDYELTAGIRRVEELMISLVKR